MILGKPSLVPFVHQGNERMEPATAKYFSRVQRHYVRLALVNQRHTLVMVVPVVTGYVHEEIVKQCNIALECFGKILALVRFLLAGRAPDDVAFCLFFLLNVVLT